MENSIKIGFKWKSRRKWVKWYGYISVEARRTNSIFIILWITTMGNCVYLLHTIARSRACVCVCVSKLCAAPCLRVIYENLFISYSTLQHICTNVAAAATADTARQVQYCIYWVVRDEYPSPIYLKRTKFGWQKAKKLFPTFFARLILSRPSWKHNYELQHFVCAAQSVRELTIHALAHTQTLKLTLDSFPSLTTTTQQK